VDEGLKSPPSKSVDADSFQGRLEEATAECRQFPFMNLGRVYLRHAAKNALSAAAWQQLSILILRNRREPIACLSPA
jgi:hypothetical protein